jgi:hypothetical protein
VLGLSAGRPIRAMIERMRQICRSSSCGTVYPPISPDIGDRPANRTGRLLPIMPFLGSKISSAAGRESPPTGPDPRRALGPAAIRAASAGRTRNRTRPIPQKRQAKGAIHTCPGAVLQSTSRPHDKVVGCCSHKRGPYRGAHATPGFHRPNCGHRTTDSTFVHIRENWGTDLAHGCAYACG